MNEEELNDLIPVAERRPICAYLPLHRMTEPGYCFPVPPELMGEGGKRYDTIRQAIYRWGYRRGIQFSMKRRDDGLLWVERVGASARKQKQASEAGRDTVQDTSLQEPGVQEAHPVGAE